MSGLVSHGDEGWLLDSGETCGVTYERNSMMNLKTSDRHITIRNGNQIPTLGQGTVTPRSEYGATINVPNVYYTPGFAKNILSLQTLLDNDWTFSGATKQPLVLSCGNNKVDFKTNPQDNLFYLKAKRVGTEKPTVITVSQQNISMDINVAHSILGHLDTRIVEMMALQHGWTLMGTNLPCGSCALAKARSKEFRNPR